MSQLDDLDDLIASLDTAQNPVPPSGSGGRRDSFDVLLESLSGSGSPALSKRASRPVSRRLSRKPSGANILPAAGGAPMPAGATASFEALLDSLNDPPSSPAPAPPGSGSPSSRLSRAPMSPHSEPPAPHAAKADDDLLDHLLESLDIGSAPPPAAPARASAAHQQPAGNPRASLSQPGRASATSAQPANPRASVRQEAATAFAGVEDSLDSLLAALDGASSGNSSPAVAPRTPASSSSYSAPQSSSAGGEADFDSLLAQLSGEQPAPAPARNVPAASSRRQPQPDMATLRPSFAETVRQSLPQPMHATFEELSAAAEWEAEPARQSLPQPSRASVVYADERRDSGSHLQPQYATVESIEPAQPHGYGPRPVSQQMPQPQPRASAGYGSGGVPSPTPSPYGSAGSGGSSPGQGYASPQQARYSQQSPPQQPYQQPAYQPPQQQQQPYQQPQQQPYQQPAYQQPQQRQSYQQPQQGYPYQQQQPQHQPYQQPAYQQHQQPQQGYPYQQQPQQQHYQPPQQAYQQAMAPSAYSTAGPRASTPIARPPAEFDGAAFEEEFKREINLLRRDPQAYARLIETERRPYYQDKIYAAPGVQRLLTREGLPACDEAIHFLMSCQPVHEVEFDSGLCLAAKQAVTEGAPTGSTNISSLNHIQAYGVLTGEISELSKFGALTGREMLMTWLISDGDASRLHRSVVTDPKWSKMGIAAAKHNSVYKTIGLATFCTGFENNTAVMDKMGSFNYLWS